MSAVADALNDVLLEMKELNEHLGEAQHLQESMQRVAKTFNLLHMSLGIQRSCLAEDTIFRPAASGV
jgi:hypothetical protein